MDECKPGSGGARPGAGRPKGARNTKTVLLEKRILQKGSGRTPLAVLLRLMDHYVDIVDAEKAKAEPDEAIMAEAMRNAGIAAERAAPFLHAKLSAVQAAVETTTAVSVIRAPEQCASSKEWLEKYRPPAADPNAPATPLEIAIEKQAQEATAARDRAIGRPWGPGDPIQ